MRRLRVRYTKEGRTRFVSARDLPSVWERALRRADLPIAYSEGFTPHPKVSFPDALPVGYASTGEYAELTFAVPVDPHDAVARLDVELPEGMDILAAVAVPEGAPRLATLLRATLWELVYPTGVLRTELGAAVGELLGADRAEIERPHPGGTRTIDVRPAVLAVHVGHLDGGTTPVIRAVLRNDGPTVRPTDLHAALARYVPLPDPTLCRRVVQGRATEDGIAEALTGKLEPLAPGRLAGAA